MKSILTTRLCLLAAAAMIFIGAQPLQAEDYGIQESRGKIWKLLKEERPDYYGERETGQDRERLKVIYSHVENTSSNLAEEQDVFIATSLEKEDLKFGIGWPASPSAVTPPAGDVNPELAAAADEQIDAALRAAEERWSRDRQPAPVAVKVSKDPQNVEKLSDKPTVKPFSTLWKTVNAGDEERVRLSKAEVAKTQPPMLAETDEPVVVMAEQDPAHAKDPAVEASRTVQFAEKQAAKEDAAEARILQELVDRVNQVAQEDGSVKEEIVLAEEVRDVPDQKGFLSGMKSFFRGGKRITAGEAEAAEADRTEEPEVVDVVVTATPLDNKTVDIVDDAVLAAVVSTPQPEVRNDTKIIYTEEDIEPAAVIVPEGAEKKEDLPEELLLAKVSDEPLKDLPNPVIINEVKKETDVPVEEEANGQIAKNQGIIFQQDIPETQPEEEKPEPVAAETPQKKAVKKAEKKSVHKKTARKAVSTKPITPVEPEEMDEDDEVEAEFIALRDSMRAEEDEVATMDIHDDGPEEEDLVTKIKRKLSPSGLLEEEVAELDYWDVPVEEQTVEDISRNLKIEQALKEAAEIQMQEEVPAPSRAPYEQQETMVISPEAIVRQAIPVQNRGKRIDLDFDNTNLSDILLIMGEAGDMNIMLDPSLKNNTLDLHLKQISLEDALLLIAQSYDLGFKLVGQALFITENEKLRYENKVSRMIKVRNVNVQEAKNLVEELADNVSVSEELNSLIVTGDPKDVVQVQKLVDMLDNPQPQVVLEAKIIEVDKNALKDLGVDWSDQINLLYQESGRPQDFDDVENADSGFYRIAQIQRNPVQFETTIRMLEQQNKAKVLSAPRVSTLNGKEAQIFVGDEVPYTITNITGGVVTNDVRFVEPGIRLTITPSIIEKNFVVMKVEPEVSFIVAFRGPNDEFPQVRTREATAHVRVENKQPFVLGGILNQEDKQSLFKVPFFGDLPLFGNLFSYERNTAVDTELIITVIPTIVHGRE